MKIAVVGAGAAGMSAAWLAARNPAVQLTIFEERHQLGGHANTVEVRNCIVNYACMRRFAFCKAPAMFERGTRTRKSAVR